MDTHSNSSPVHPSWNADRAVRMGARARQHAGGIVDTDSCIPDVSDETKTVEDFIERGWDEISESARDQVRRLDRLADSTSEAGFMSRIHEVVGKPGSVFVGFRRIVEHMNEALGSGGHITGFAGWAQGMIGAFLGDTDELAKTAAVLGIVPVLGDLMGVLDGAVKGDWNETALSALGLLGIFAGATVPVVGEVIDIVAALYMEALTLINLIKDLIEGWPADIDVIRAQRDYAWKQSLLKIADEETIPQMEEGWRRLEQGVLTSFAAMIAMIDLKAEQAVTAAPRERREVLDVAARVKERLWTQLGWYLADAAASFQVQMQAVLVRLVTDPTSLSNFTGQFVDFAAGSWAEGVFENCLSLNPDIKHCASVASEERELVCNAGKELQAQESKNPPSVLTELSEDLFKLFDKDGRFWPRVQPPSPFAAPHILSAVCSGQRGIVSWHRPRSLPSALVAKADFCVRWMGNKDPDALYANGSAAAATLDIGDNRGWENGRFEAYFIPPRPMIRTINSDGDVVLNPYPRPSDPSLPIDMLPEQSPRSGFAFTYPDLGECRGHIDQTASNEGLGPLVGEFVIINVATGMAMEPRGQSLESQAPVVQNPISVNGSQVWELNAAPPKAGSFWGPTTVTNSASGKRLDCGDAVAQDSKAYQMDPVSGSRQIWRPQLASAESTLESGAFYLESTLQHRVVAASSDDRDTQLALQMPEDQSEHGLWKFVQSVSVLPVVGRYYTIINEFNGMAVEINEDRRAIQKVPDQSSIDQVFHLQVYPGSLPNTQSLWSPSKGIWLIFGSMPGDGNSCYFTPAGGGAWKIVTTYRGAERAHHVLEVPGPVRNPGAMLKQGEDDGQPHQMWRLAEIGNERDPRDIFVIGSALSGLVAGVKDGSKEDWAAVTQQEFTGRLSQLWMARRVDDDDVYGIDVYVITNLGTGGSLGVWENDKLIYQRQQVYDNSVYWKLLPTPGGWWVLRNVATGHVLAEPGDQEDTPVPGRNLVREDHAAGKDGSLWKLDLSSPQGSYRIVSAVTGFAAGPAAPEAIPDYVAQVVADTTDTVLDQVWDLTLESDDTYVLVNVASGKAMGLIGNGDTPTHIVQAPDTGKAGQRWRLERDGGLWRFVNADKGLALEAIGKDSTTRTALEAKRPDPSSKEQRWRLIPVSPQPVPNQVYALRSALYRSLLEPTPGLDESYVPAVLRQETGQSCQQWRYVVEDRGNYLVHDASGGVPYPSGASGGKIWVRMAGFTPACLMRFNYQQGYWRIRTSAETLLTAADSDEEKRVRNVVHQGRPDLDTLWLLEPASAPMLVEGRSYTLGSAEVEIVSEGESASVTRWLIEPKNVATEGSAVELTPRHGGISQHWTLERETDCVRFKNQKSGMYLSVWSDGIHQRVAAAGRSIDLQLEEAGGDWVICNFYKGSSWSVTSAGLKSSLVKQGAVSLIAKLDNPKSVESSRALASRWIVTPVLGPEPQSDHVYAILSAENGWALEPEGYPKYPDITGRESSDSPVILRPREPENKAQHWRLTELPQGGWRFLNKGSGKYLSLGRSSEIDTTVNQVVAAARTTTDLRVEAIGADIVIGHISNKNSGTSHDPLMMLAGLESDGQRGPQMSLTTTSYDIGQAERSSSCRFFLSPVKGH